MATAPGIAPQRMEKPRQGWAGLAMISFGFFGIQIGFALQNANMSRIFQTLGTSLDDLPALWVAAPLTGLLVQPIIGHYSDRTWSRLGRRRPYFLAGAVLAALALPDHAAGAVAAARRDDCCGCSTPSLNISMEPFRAFVGDMLRKDQHTAGYAVQTAFIGAGAVVGSIFPCLLDQLRRRQRRGGGRHARHGPLQLLVRRRGAVPGGAVDRPHDARIQPDEMRAFRRARASGRRRADTDARARRARPWRSALWIAGGCAIVALVVERLGCEKEVYLLGGAARGLRPGQHAAIAHGQARAAATICSAHIVGDFAGMPPIMKRLALVQFFSWSALFIMWINTTPVVAQYVFGTTDTASAAYNEGGNWVGVLFAVYNGVAAIAALTLLPWLARRLGQGAHACRSACCAARRGLPASSFIRDPQWLLMARDRHRHRLGVDPRHALCDPRLAACRRRKLGIYMGLFNVFIVVPQLLVATVMGTIVKAFFPTEPIWTMAFARGDGARGAGDAAGAGGVDRPPRNGEDLIIPPDSCSPARSCPSTAPALPAPVPAPRAFSPRAPRRIVSTARAAGSCGRRWRGFLGLAR